MQGTFFLDSNVVLYALSESDEKRYKARMLLERDPIISSQVMGETAFVLRKKWKWHHDDIIAVMESSFQWAMMIEIRRETIHRALDIAKRYGFSYYDCQIIASALEAGCDVLYSEDLHHSQRIDGRLNIINPFKFYGATADPMR